MPERFTYLLLLIAWAGPVLALHWAVGAPELRRRARLLAVAVVVPTIYLTAADSIAIESGIWQISERYSLGLRWRGLVVEEALFFLLTNTLVAQSIILFLSPEVRARMWRLRGRLLRRTGMHWRAVTGPRGAAGPGSTTSLPRLHRLAFALVVALLALLADAVATRGVEQGLALGERRELIPGLLILTRIENTGAAYGLFSGQRWLLIAISSLVLLLTPFLLRALPVSGRWAWTAPVLSGLFVGGAAGNLIERVAYGYVTDFLQVPPVPLFQVFNLSDVGITLAVVGLITLSLAGAGQGTPVPANSRHQSNGAAP